MPVDADTSNLINQLNYQPIELDFGTSGLRGKVADMTDLECYINVTGFIRFLFSSGALARGSTISLAGDLRSSTPRIMQAAQRAIVDSDCQAENLGFIPTPAIACWAMTRSQASIMVTGSHIPDDRNGIKFYKPDGEVLKDDEKAKLVESLKQELNL